MPGKVLTRILENRLRNTSETSQDDSQHGFKRGKGVRRDTREISKALYKNNTNKVRTDNNEYSEFSIKIGFKQGCAKDVIKKYKEKRTKMIVGNQKIETIIVQELLLIEDMELIADTEENLQKNIQN